MTSVAGASPTSLSQQRIWFIEHLVPGTAALHHRHAAFVVHGELDVPALERAVNGVIDRHDALRTRFGFEDGTPVQEVRDEARVTVQMLDALDDASVFARAEVFAREPFDLAHAPLLRVGLIQGSEETRALVFVLHHLVADARSVAIFLREVAELYRQDGPGHARELPESPIRYADYATQQREWAHTPEAAKQRGARIARLTGFPTVLDLPSDRSRPTVQTFAGRCLSWQVPPPLARSLEQVAREYGASLRTMLLASFSVVLGIWSGQSRLLVGTPAAERPSADTEHLIGSFTNTLVIPADFTGAPSFISHLDRMHHAYRTAEAQPNVTFEELVEGMAQERSLAHNPLVQAMVSVSDSAIPQLRLPNLDLRPIETTGASPFDLVLDAVPHKGGLACRLWYSTDLFEGATAERFQRHLLRLLSIVAENPSVSLENIDLADAEERARLAELGTGPARPVDPRALPARLIEAARRHPDAVAVRAPDGVYSFAQLVERAGAIGAELVAKGLRPGDLAGVALPRGRDLPAGLLGVWLAGCAYVPLDPVYPRARLEHMTQDAGITVLLSTRDLVDRIPVPAKTRILVLDEPMSTPADEQPLPVLDGDSIAYVIYTSGSTGRPKGVLITHASLGNLLDDFAHESGFDAGDRLLALTSLSFDIAGLELWLPLLTGGTLVIGPPGAGGDPQRLHRLLTSERITVVQATPATWKLYTSFNNAAPPALRQIWSGGEHLPHSLAQALTALGPEVHNLYGPTETTIWSTRAVLRRLDTATGIGRPIANTRLFVTDAAGRLVPLGVPGELCIGGAGLALGYLGRPELTAQRFTEVEGTPLYRTGDLVRWRSDGNMEFLGRLDDQVKIRGHRVEPGEVDTTARTCPGVRDACTLAVTAADGESHLVTFVTPERASDQIGNTTEDWRKIWENAYAAGEPALADDFNVKGWKSSYTKQPLPESDMRDWVSRTVDRIAETGARSFAEIGCGTGLLLLRLAPIADRYLGVDFSAKAIGHVAEAVERRGIGDRVRLVTAAATEISQAAAGELFDCVLLNSVAQYFPSRDYLTVVLTEASKIVRPGGHIFVGDLRSLRLAEAFHASVLRADERIRPVELRALAARHALEEDELLLDPGYFAALQDALPAVTGIQVSLKASRFDNEMTRFRYDVLLQIGGKASDQQPAGEEHGWEEVVDLPGLEGLLGASNAATLVVDGIPSARVAQFVSMMADDAAIPPSYTLNEVDEAAARHGWCAHHAWSSQRPEEGRIRTTFMRPEGRARFVHARPANDGPVSNDPREGGLLRVLKHSTRAFLRQRLPEYMVPTRILTLPDLPLTPNGKIDRNALKSVAQQLRSGADHVPPSDPVQDLLHEVWCEVLGVSRVSVMENIFDAGSTSLVIVRVHQELRDRHGIDVPLTAFFAHPTISALAKFLQSAERRSLQPEPERPSSDERAPSRRTRDANATAARRRHHRLPDEKLDTTAVEQAEPEPPAPSGDDGERGFWRRRLSGLDKLELPVDRPRPPIRSRVGDAMAFRIGAETVQGLRELVRNDGTTLHVALLAVFQALLARHTGQDDIAVGTTAAGRGARRNTVVVRVDLSGDPAVRELFVRVHGRVLEAFAHRGVPFDQVVSTLVPHRDPSDTPLFRATFALADGEEADPVPIGPPVAEVDLAMSVRPVDDTLSVRLTYAADLFERATVQRMAGHFQVLLSGAVANPGTRLSEWEMITPAERHRILVEFNDTAAEFPRDTPTHELIEERVAAAPRLPAVTSGDLTLSYAELNERANRLAHHLRGMGVGPGTLVAIGLSRGIDTVVAPLAILKAGGAYVPLDPEYPAARLTFMLDDTEAPIVVTESALAGRLSGGGRRLVRLDTDGEAIAAHPPTDPGRVAEASDLAYVIYTSGSTGTPKGVQITHRNLVNLLVAMGRDFPIAPGEALLAVTATTFDISAIELLLPLLGHGTVVIADPAQVTSPAGLGALVERHNVRHIQATPSLWRLILDAAPDALAGVRVYTGGEPLPVDLAERLASRSAGVTNLYGPTETTIWSTTTALRDVRPAGGTVPIGRPVANTVTYVVDRHDRPVPVGVAGELLIGGEGVSPGYLNRPELTAERFVECTVTDGPPIRVYRTGDVVRWLPDGDLDFLGRADDQVKLRGFRIELGEIEAVLATHDSVGSCAVLVREDVPGERRLVAYATTVGEAALAGGDLRVYARERLPEYLVPEVFVLLAALPLTSSGKVDRRSLLAPDEGRPDTGHAFVAPRNELEEAVAEIWAEVLGIDRVGAHDDFFELGGQSVKAAQVVNRLGALTGLELSLNVLFEAPTLAKLTAWLVETFAAQEAGR